MEKQIYRSEFHILIRNILINPPINNRIEYALFNESGRYIFINYEFNEEEIAKEIHISESFYQKLLQTNEFDNYIKTQIIDGISEIIKVKNNIVKIDKELLKIIKQKEK